MQWSPPYLWTGFHIQHYNITVTDLNDNSLVTFDMLNATFSDALVSHIYHIDPYQGQMCTELLFSLSSITNRGESLTTFHIKGEHSACKHQILDILH